MWTEHIPGGSEGKESASSAADQEMATHPSILAWRISWTEEPCRLQSMGSQKVRRDWATVLLVGVRDKLKYVLM